MQRFLHCALLLAVVGAALAAAEPARASWSGDAKLARSGITNALRREWLTADAAADYRATLARATATWRGLSGSRASNLAGALHDVTRQRTAYIAPRAYALFSMLDMNARYLGSDAMPPAGTDVYGDGGVLYRSFPGHGLQFHPLGNFARLNTLLARDDSAGAAELAAELIERAIPRRGTLVWEYYFPFGGGSPPWTSGMVQAVAARAFAADGDLDVARQAYLAVPPLTFALGGGSWVKLYSFNRLAVLNAQLQAYLSLADYARRTEDPTASALADRLLQTADSLFPRFDTGAWSLYALGGGEAPLKYQRYVADLTERIADGTHDATWAARAERFAQYLTEPPVVNVRAPTKPVRRRATIRLWLSKMSRVTLRVGRFATVSTFARGYHTLSWRAPRPGRYSASLSAVDLAGNRTDVPLSPIRVVRRTAALP